MNGDEYNKSSPFYADPHSLMNIGRQMRPRHVELIATTLNEMVPGCQFTAILC